MGSDEQLYSTWGTVDLAIKETLSFWFNLFLPSPLPLRNPSFSFFTLTPPLCAPIINLPFFLFSEMPNRAWLLSVLFPLILTATESKDYEFNVAWSYRSPDCVERPIMTINDDFPGPTIRVKVGEEVRVNVNNNLPSDAITIHWHGQEQRENVWHDGIGKSSERISSKITRIIIRFWETAHLPLP